MIRFATGLPERFDDALLARFHGGIYWDAFAAQHEPLAAWRAALAGDAAYELRIDLVVDGEEPIAGVTYERYPRSRCGFLTYLVVASSHRRSGLGKRLLDGALANLADMRAVFGEVNDPRRTGEWERLERFQRWGARVLDVRYVQPSLGEGLERDRGLLLMAFPPIGELPVRAFVEELYEVTEGAMPDEVIPQTCSTRSLRREEP